MKPILMAFLFALCFTVNAGAEKIKITKKGGTCDNKFNYVEEEHKDASKVHTLSCEDPGSSPCAWNFPPSPPKLPGGPDPIEFYIQNQIMSGLASGTVRWGTGGDVIAVWHDGIYHANCGTFEYTIDIYIDEVPAGF